MSFDCTALLKKVVSPSDCKITKLISLAHDLLDWINLKPPSGLLRMLETLPSGTALCAELDIDAIIYYPFKAINKRGKLQMV